jgi:pyridoxal phosphate-dependent aminotransferase EpsN
LSGDEHAFVADAFASNWVAPLGPHVTAFEQEMVCKLGAGYATALSSGTAALHLGLILLGVGAGDIVLCSTLTFAASANPIRYLGATPVFIDSEESSWNLSPALLEEALFTLSREGTPAKALIVVDLYGQCADFQPILELCHKYGVAVIEDAAEALGASYRNRAAGTFGALSVLSFNGNKIITTSGGGMLLSPTEQLAQRALFLATQARDPAPHYQHSEVGYNYRMSNVLAAIGRGQLAVLEQRVAARRRNFDFYQRELGGRPGFDFMPEAEYGVSNRWLTVLTVNPTLAGVDREQIRVHLQQLGIESRPVWKPMHQQPVFQGCRLFGGTVADLLFATGLCLPSGSAMTDEDRERVLRGILSVPGLRQ